MDLRSKLIRLAHARPDLRSDLLSILKSASVSERWKKESMDKKIERLMKRHKVTLTQDSSPYKALRPISKILDINRFCIEFKESIKPSIIEGLQEDNPSGETTKATDALAERLFELEKKSEKILKDMSEVLKKSGFKFRYNILMVEYTGEYDAHCFVDRYDVTEIKPMKE